MAKKNSVSSPIFGAVPPGWFGVAAVLALVLLTACDTVNLGNTSGNANGLLVDGRTLFGPNNDKGYVSPDPSIGLGVVWQRNGTNEVVAFTNRRAVVLRGVENWSFFGINVNMSFADEVGVPVTVWIVQGPYLNQLIDAVSGLLTTSAIWRSERVGLRFSSIRLVNATNDADAPTYTAFTCALRNGIENDIGKDNGRVNIYYVNTVDGGTGRGQACSIGSDFVAMGSATGDELLSHELGHDFSLEHVNGNANFDRTNIMHSASSSREFATEGQIYRAHFDPDSAINAVFNGRPGRVQRNCAHGAETDTCPRIHRRLWDDGAGFPSD